MSHESHHSNPFLSIILGCIFSLIAYVSNYKAEFLDFGIGLFKAIVYGVTGGIFGYIGRIFIITMLKKIKRHDTNSK